MPGRKCLQRRSAAGIPRSVGFESRPHHLIIGVYQNGAEGKIELLRIGEIRHRPELLRGGLPQQAKTNPPASDVAA